MSTSSLHQCGNCRAKFSSINIPTCAICTRLFCPECGGCECTRRTIQKSAKYEYRSFKPLKISEINFHEKSENLEINGTLSPLIRQKPVNTVYGKLLISEFEISDETGKLPLIIWGPVPAELFPTRYEYIQLIIKGIKTKVFNNQLQLHLQKNANISINQIRNKPLLVFLEGTA